MSKLNFTVPNSCSLEPCSFPEAQMEQPVPGSQSLGHSPVLTVTLLDHQDSFFESISLPLSHYNYMQI